MIYVVAGNREEFKEWLDSTKLKYKMGHVVKYVDKLDITRSSIGQELVLLVGKYWENPLIEQLADLEAQGTIYFVRPKCEEEDV